MRELGFDDVVRRTNTAATAEVDGQMVALDVTEGICYGLNRVSTRIWTLLQNPKSASAISAVLRTEYDVDAATCEAQTLDLLRELHRAGLVAAEPGGA